MFNFFVLLILVSPFTELVHNYCKWLATHKSVDTALLNWNEFHKMKTVTQQQNKDGVKVKETKIQFDQSKPYQCFI